MAIKFTIAEINNKQKESRKTMDIITVSHNGRSRQWDISGGMTAGDLKTDAELRAALGNGDNVDVVVNGSVVDDAYPLRGGQEASYRSRAATKATVTL